MIKFLKSRSWTRNPIFVFWIVLLWLFPFGSGHVVAAAPNARDVVKSGTIELGFLSGYWQGNNFFGNAPNANRTAVYFLPQIGMVLTDEVGPGFFAGNFELLVEPLAAHYYEPFSASAFGGSLVMKYNFLSFGRVMPFWDAGAGMLWTDLAPRIPEQSTPFNFVLQTGPGVHVFFTKQLALTLGVRFHHISNANLGDRNLGLNAWLVNGGFSFFLPR